MAKNMTRDELMLEIIAAIENPVPIIGENEIPLVELARDQGTKTDVIHRRLLKNMPAGCEIVDRRGYNGRTIKCIRHIPE